MADNTDDNTLDDLLDDITTGTTDNITTTDNNTDTDDDPTSDIDDITTVNPPTPPIVTPPTDDNNADTDYSDTDIYDDIVIDAIPLTPPIDKPVILKDAKVGNLAPILITERGNCLPDSNCYTSLEFADNYFRERGNSVWSELSVASKIRALVIGNDFVDRYYKWKGLKLTQSQALSFPRTQLIDNDGFVVYGIPLNLQKAVCEAALLVVSGATDNDNTAGLFHTWDANGGIHSKKVDVLEVEYFSNRTSSYARTYESTYEALNALLNGLYKTNADENSYNVGAFWLDM